MTTNLLTKGGNTTLPAGLTELCIGLSWEAPGASFDLDAWTFLLNAAGRTPSDDHFIFYGNRKSPCNSVFVSEDNQQGGSEDEDDEVVTVRLQDVPADIDKIVCVVNIHLGRKHGQNFGQLDNAAIRLFTRNADGSTEEITRYNMGEGDVSTETSLIFGELYRHNGAWKFRAIAQGSDSGPAMLARSYGVDVDDDPNDVAPPAATTATVTPSASMAKPVASASTPAAQPAAPATPINLSKGRISLTKAGEAATIAATPSMEFSLYWTKPSKDLGLIFLATLQDGTKLSYDWRCLQDKHGEVLHHGDRKKGGGEVREYVTLTLKPDTKIAAMGVVAYSEVSNGIGSFKSMGAHAVIDDGNGTKVTVDLNKGGTFSYHTVIATIVVNPDRSLTVERASRFSASGKEERPEIGADGTVSMNTGPCVFKPPSY